MPNNINHVVVGNETKLDLREDTVTPSTMVNGIVAHDASGVRIVGTFDPSIFVLKAGDTMSGPLTFDTSNTNAIRYAGTNGTYAMIKFKDNTIDNYGNGIVIGGGGLTIVGGGESADTVAAQYTTGGSEVLELASDEAVYIRSNVNNGFSSAKSFVFGDNGYLTVSNGGVAATGDITVNNATSEKVIRIGTQSGAQVSLCFGTSLNQGVYSSGYTTDISDSSKYTSSGLWIIARGSDGSVNIPNWASIGNSTTPVYINAAGKPTPVSSIDVSNADYLREADTRNDNFLPSTYMSSLGRKMRYEFKTRATIGAPGSSTYVSILTFSPWADSSGGRPSQLSIDPDGTIGFRISGNDSTWNAWNKLVTTKAEPATAPKYLESAFSRSETPINQPGHLYDNSRVHMRLDGVFNAPVAFGNADGFTLSFFWDNSGAYDSQLFIPNGTGEPMIRKRAAGSSWSTDVNDTAHYSKIITNTTPSTKVTFTPTTGTATTPSPGCWYAKYGKVVELTFNVSGLTAGATSYSQQITTLPAGYRPQNDIWGVANNDGVTMGVWIRSSGEVLIKPTSGACHFHTTFIVE